MRQQERQHGPAINRAVDGTTVVMPVHLHRKVKTSPYLQSLPAPTFPRPDRCQAAAGAAGCCRCRRLPDLSFPVRSRERNPAALHSSISRNSRLLHSAGAGTASPTLGTCSSRKWSTPRRRRRDRERRTRKNNYFCLLEFLKFYKSSSS